MTTDMWTCGHEAGAMCAECYRILAQQAHELAVENLALKKSLKAALDTLARADVARRNP
jgi:hypothetical protein